MCKEALAAIIELEHYGVPFLAHRRRQDLPAPVRRHVTTDYGKGVAQRTCAAADRRATRSCTSLYQ